MTDATEQDTTSTAGLSRPAGDLLVMSYVSRAFDDGTPALSDVSLRIDGPELVAVVGRSGCGKTTLLRLAAGLDAPTAGTVTTRESTFGYVSQDPGLLEWRTAAGNVELVGELDGTPRLERRDQAREALAQVGLEGFEDHYPRQLSGGMRMRVSVARALVTDTRLALFDEPFGALDELTRQQLQTEVQHLFYRRAMSCLLVTHSIAEAVFLADRVLVMSDRPGEIVADIAIPLPQPRPPETRHNAEFGALTGQVTAALSSGTTLRDPR